MKHTKPNQNSSTQNQFFSSNSKMKINLKKTIALSFAILFLVAFQSQAANFDLTLQWDENTEPDLATGANPRYKIYYKTASSGAGIKSNYLGLPAAEPAVADEGTSAVNVITARDENPDPDVVQFTLHNLDDTQTYYIAVSALDNEGNESLLSDEISTANPITNPNPIDPTLDTDEDGMPDVFESDYGLNPLVDDANEDSDGDGIINIDEYREGTDPMAQDYGKQAMALYPADSAANVELAPVLQTVEYPQTTPYSAPAHLQTQWQISTSSNFDSADIVFDVTCNSNLEEIEVPEFTLNPDQTYFWRARFYDVSNIGAVWSDAVQFHTTAASPLDANGVFEGQAVEDGTADLDGAAGNDTFTDTYKAVNTVIGSGMIGIKVPAGTAIEALKSIDPLDIDDLANKPEDMDMGLLQFKLSGDVGFVTDVTLYFSEDLPGNAAWYKYDCVNGWGDASNIASITGPREIVLTLEDGGIGDADGVANGVIIDPSGYGAAGSGAPLQLRLQAAAAADVLLAAFFNPQITQIFADLKTS